MTRRGVWAIGLGQCVNWGVLYYAFGVLVVPIERDLDLARWIVVGAFSAGAAGLGADRSGRGHLVDRGHGPAVLQAGGLLAAALLAVWAMSSNVWLCTHLDRDRLLHVGRVVRAGVRDRRKSHR